MPPAEASGATVVGTAVKVSPPKVEFVRTIDAGSAGVTGGSFAFAPDGSIYFYNVPPDPTTTSRTVIRVAADGKKLTEWGSAGSGPGQFALFDPTSGDWVAGTIMVASDGNVYVVDSDNFRIQIFDPNGTFLRQIGGAAGVGELVANEWFATALLDKDDNICVDYHDGGFVRYDSFGKKLFDYRNSHTESVQGIDLESGDVFVADIFSGETAVYDSNNRTVATFGSTGTGPGQFVDYAYGIGRDSSGRYYAVDGTAKIQVFDASGKYLAAITHVGDKPLTEIDTLLMIGDTIYADSRAGKIVVFKVT